MFLDVQQSSRQKIERYNGRRTWVISIIYFALCKHCHNATRDDAMKSQTKARIAPSISWDTDAFHVLSRAREFLEVRKTSIANNDLVIEGRSSKEQFSCKSRHGDVTLLYLSNAEKGGGAGAAGSVTGIILVLNSAVKASSVTL